MRAVDYILLAGPLVIATVLLVSWSYKQSDSSPIAMQLDTTTDDDGCSVCPKKDIDGECSVSGGYILGGIDVVQYFTDFKMSDGTYNESMIPSIGDDSITSTYGDYQLKFTTQEHKELFDASPQSYLPQFGGFCSWGVSAEFCPDFPWEVDCLGPPGDVSHWTIVDEKLYIFYFDSVKQSFLEDTDGYVGIGSDRWSSWFPDNSYFNTACVYGVSR